MEYVKVELTDENSEADVQKVATRQEEFSCKNIKARTIENKSRPVTSDEKAANNGNQGCSESVEDSTRSEVKEEKITIPEKQKFIENKGNSDSRFLGFGITGPQRLHMAYHRQQRLTRGEDTNTIPPTYSLRDVVSMPWYKSYDAARTSFGSQRYSGRRVTTARRSYNTKRTDNLRASRGKESMRQIQEALDAELGVRLKEVEDALNQIEANKTMKAVTLLVTTRTLGFCAAQIYFQSSAQRNPTYCNIYAFYRVNLALFEARLYNIRKIQEAPIQFSEDVYDVPTRPEFLQVTQTVNAYPDQIGRILQSLGPVSEGDEYYVPALSATQHTRQGMLIPQSERVVLSNLRDTVVALANPATQPQVREVFYQHNPIPGAIWRVENGTHVLENPDEIMPEEYGVEGLRDDIDDYVRMFTWMQKKLPKFVRTSKLSNAEKGDRSLFVSNAQENLHIADRVDGQPLAEYYSRLKLEGNIYDFWSPRGVKKSEQLDGQMNLLGEIPSLANYVYPYYCLRDERASGWHYSTDYKGVKQKIYG